MSIEDDIRPVTYLKSRAADLLAQVNETHRPVIITQNGEVRAVLQDPQSYESMRNALGEVRPQDEVLSRIEKAIGKR